MRQTTQCYIRRKNEILMLYRNKKPQDPNEGKWLGIGGKVEPGETPQEALVREIKEELDADIVVGELLTTVEYDYPKFHLSMDCFWATLAEGSRVKLLEHEAAKWLSIDEIDTVNWLPADEDLLPLIEGEL